MAGPSRAPAPQHKQAPDTEPPGSAGGGGGPRGGAEQPGNPSLSGPRGSVWGGAYPLTPWPPPGLHPLSPSGSPAPGLPGDTGGCAGPEVSTLQPRAPRGRADQPLPSSGRGPGAGLFLRGKAQGSQIGMAPGLGGGLLRLRVGGFPGYWGQGGISPAQAGLG